MTKCPKCKTELRLVPARSKGNKLELLQPDAADHFLNHPAVIERLLLPLAQTGVTCLLAAIAASLLTAGNKHAISLIVVVTAVAAWLWPKDATPQQQPPPPPPTTDAIRLVKLTDRNVAQPTPRLALPDGRSIQPDKLNDMLISKDLALSRWKKRGWTRSEWETARDILSRFSIATPRTERQAGQLLVSPRQARETLGMSPPL